MKSIGLILFIIILHRTDFSFLVLSIKQLTWEAITLLGIVAVFVILLSGFSWFLILKSFHASLPVFQLIRFHLSSLFEGLISPGRMGELSKVWYLKQAGVPYSTGFASFFISRVIDFMSICFVGSAAAFFYYRTVSLSPLFWSGIVMTVILLVCILGIILMPSLVCFLEIKANRNRSAKRFGKLYLLSDLIQKGRKIHPLMWIFLGIMGLARWIAMYLSFFSIAGQLDIPLSVLAVIALGALGSVINVIPVSISGIGTRDALFIFIFHNLGLKSEKAVLFSSLFIILFFITLSISFLGWLSMLDHRIKRTDLLIGEGDEAV